MDKALEVSAAHKALHKLERSMQILCLQASKEGLAFKYNEEAFDIIRAALPTDEEKAKWFVYDPNDGAFVFDSEQKAIEGASNIIKDYLDGDGWNDEVEQVWYGKITGVATKTDIQERPVVLDEEGCDENGEYWGALAYKCDYKLLPLAAKRRRS